MNNYKCNDDFNVRIPLLSLDYYNNNLKNYKYDNGNCKRIVENTFSEPLLTLSSELYEALYSSSSKNNEELSVLKYLIRSSTRATPYGLTSGIYKGTFAKKNECLNEIEHNLYKRVRPDMEWLVNVIKLVEKELGEELIIVNNNTFKKRQDLYIKTWNSCFQANSNNITKINATNAVNKIFDICKSPIKIKDLISQIQEIFAEDYVIIFNVVWKLLDQEFLVSEFRQSNSQINQLEEVLNKLKKYECSSPLLDNLLEIYNLIKEYEKLPINQGKEMYSNLINRMKEIYVVKDYLQIDCYNNFEMVKLPFECKSELTDFINFLSKISYYDTFDEEIRRYNEKFGDTAIKFIDLINDEEFNFNRINQTTKLKYMDEFYKTFISLILTKNENKEIDLYEIEKDLYNLSEKFNFEDRNYSCELAVYVLKFQDKFKYVISPLIGSDMQGKIMGRFNYMFNKRNETIKSNCYSFSFIPTKARHYNVSTSSLIDRNKEINLGSFDHIENKLNLEDIYVCIKDECFYFLNKKTKEEIEFICTDMLTDLAFPPVVKTILQIQNSQKGPFFNLVYKVLDIMKNCKKEHIPRIVYKNIVISPMMWNYSEFNSDNKLPYEKFKKVFMDFCNLYKIPDNVYIGTSDNRILLNVYEESHINIVWKMYTSNEKILLYENFMNEDTLLIHSKEEYYVGEFIFSFVKTSSASKKSTLLYNRDYKTYKLLEDEKLSLCENWIYIKLYMNQHSENNFIAGYLPKLYNELANYIDCFFYIRYRDPNSHIRLRLMLKEEYADIGRKAVFSKIKELKLNNVISAYCVDTYCPETYRYGGAECLPLAHQVFAADSLLCMNLVGTCVYGLSKFNLQQLYLLSAARILNNFGLDLEEQIDLLDVFQYGKKKNNEYDNISKEVNDYIFDENNIYFSQNGEKLVCNYIITDSSFQKYGELIHRLFEREKERKREIILSILHMHFNRLVGVDRNLENKTMGHLRKLLFTKYQRDKNMKVSRHKNETEFEF